ncbi:MAG: hypothetical protein Q7T80_02735 [Methanoregula sp.]|nr:hypothetical protein [Methanoregula sp.]
MTELINGYVPAESATVRVAPQCFGAALKPGVLISIITLFSIVPEIGFYLFQQS